MGWSSLNTHWPTHVWPFVFFSFFNFIFSSFFLIHPFFHKYPLSSSSLPAFLHTFIFFLLLHFSIFLHAHTSSKNPISNFSSFLLPTNWKALRVNFSQFHPRPTPLSLCSPKTKLESKLDGSIEATPRHLNPMVLEDSNLMLEWDQWWSDGGPCPYLVVAMIFSICHFCVFCGHRVGINLGVYNKVESNLEIKIMFYPILGSRTFWSGYKMIWLSQFKPIHI